MCWTWYWNKVRNAQPMVVSWSIIVEGTAVEFPAITERKRDGELLLYPQTSGLGPRRNDLCAGKSCRRRVPPLSGCAD